MLKIIEKRKYSYIFSLILVAVSVIVLSIWGLKLGIDFRGGTQMDVQFSIEKQISNNQIADSLQDIELNSLQIQRTENGEYILKYIASDEDANEKVLAKLKGLDENVKQLSVDFIGASVSGQIKTSAVEAIILSIFAIAAYIAWAFRKVSYPIPSWQYGLGAIIALAHDIIITLGVFAILGRFWGIEVGVPFVAALLTILGYSVNDTIVVYDRTRENIVRSSRSENFESIVNRSLNETLARSINTSLTVVIVLTAIVFFGGTSIKFFSVALLVGVLFGTYSSIFVATALLVTSYRYKIR